MKNVIRICIAVLLFSLVDFAQTTTPNVGLNVPLHDTPNWDVLMNANFNLIDSMFSGNTAVPKLNVNLLQLGGLTPGCLNIDSSHNVGVTTCGSGGGGGSISATPSAAQTIIQPIGTALQVNNLEGLRYTDQFIWSQSPTASVVSGAPTSVTLSPCPRGVDIAADYRLGVGTSTVGNLGGYMVALSGGGHSEAVFVSGGTACTSGSMTISFTAVNSYTAGSYTVGTAGSGIQEAINDGCGVSTTYSLNSGCHIKIPNSATAWPVSGRIFFHASNAKLEGYGATLGCTGRGPCLQLGHQIDTNYNNITVAGISFQAPTDLSGNPAYAGSQIASTQRSSSGLVTITTATSHALLSGDPVTILHTDRSIYWGDVPAITVTSATTFTYQDQCVASCTIALETTPGIVALTYVAILDNAENAKIMDVRNTKFNNGGKFNNWIDIWDDENSVIDDFDNQGASINGNVNWVGCYVCSFGANNLPPGTGSPTIHQLAPVITLKNSTITAQFANGVTVYNSNGLYIDNTVIQATGLWQVYSTNSTGNLQGAILRNIYSENNVTNNPVSPIRNPFPGTGVAGLIAGPGGTNTAFSIRGAQHVSGFFPTGGTGATAISYFIIIKNNTASTVSAPMQILNWLSTGSDSPIVRWPRVANGSDDIRFTLLRTATPGLLAGPFPYFGGCPGGSPTTCGSVAVDLTIASACGNTLVCTFTDSAAASTTSYTFTTNPSPFLNTLNSWPGAIVTSNKTIYVDSDHGNLVNVGLASGTPIQVADVCSAYGNTAPGTYTQCNTGGPATNTVPNQNSRLMFDGGVFGSLASGKKGILNFTQSPNYNFLSPKHIITLIDSTPGLTWATIGNRPAASANDTWIGTDQLSTSAALGQMAFGAPISITEYIANDGHLGTGWVRRVNASFDEHNVPAKFDQSVTLVGLADGCLNVTSGVITSTAVACGSGGSGFSGSYTGNSTFTGDMHLTGNATFDGTLTVGGAVGASITDTIANEPSTLTGTSGKKTFGFDTTNGVALCIGTTCSKVLTNPITEAIVTNLTSDLAAKPTASLDTDGTMAANSASRVPAQSAVVTYVAAHSGGGGSGASYAGQNNIAAGTSTYTVASTDLGKSIGDQEVTVSSTYTVPVLTANFWTMILNRGNKALTIQMSGGATINGGAANGTYTDMLNAGPHAICLYTVDGTNYSTTCPALAVEDYSAGFLSVDTHGAQVLRSMIGGTHIIVTNNTGTGGNPVVDIPSGGVTDDVASLLVKPAVSLVGDATTGNLTKSGVQTIDSVAGTADVTIVLATAQTTASENGPWLMHSGAWTRPTWYSSTSTTQAQQFSTTQVRLGTKYGGSTWHLTTSSSPTPITIDTTATTWTQIPVSFPTQTALSDNLLAANTKYADDAVAVEKTRALAAEAAIPTPPCITHYHPNPGSTDQITTTTAFATTQSVATTCIAAGSLITVKAHGVYTTTATASPKIAFSVTAGGTTGICPAPPGASPNVSITSGYWELTCEIQIITTGSPGTAQAWGGFSFDIANGSASNFSSARFANATTGTVAYTTGSAQTVSINMTATPVSGQTFNVTVIDIMVTQ